MFFAEKFNKAIEIIEENILAETNFVNNAIGREWGVPDRQAREHFNFITDMQVSEYMQRRRFEKILSYMMEHPHERIEDVAEPYGYSDRSSIDRAVSRAYGTTPAKIINGESTVELTKPLTIEKLIEKIVEGDYMKRDTLIKVEQKSSASTDSDSELLTELNACKDAYGLTLEQVVLAHTFVENKNNISLDSICRLMVENYPDKPVDSFSRFDMDCLYLVVNFELLREEAEQIVKDIRDTVKIDIRQDDTAYFWLARHIRWDDISFIDKFKYQEFIEFEPLIEELMRDAGYNEEKAQEFVNCYYDLFEVTVGYSRESITTRSSAMVNELRLTLHYKDNGCWTRNTWGSPITMYDVHEVVREMEAHGITDFTEYDKGYIDFVEARNFSYMGEHTFTYDRYLEANSILEKMNISVGAAYNRISPEEKDITVDKIVSEGRVLAHERMLMTKYGIKYSDGASFAKCLVNKFNKEEAMYELVGKIYPEVAWYNANAFFGRIPADINAIQRATLIVAANAKSSKEDAKAIAANASQETATSFYDREINNLFIEINLFTANNRLTEDYRFITYDEFNTAIDEIIRRGTDNIFAEQELYLGLFAVAYGPYDSVVEAVEEISEALEKVTMYNDKEKYWIRKVSADAERHEKIDKLIFARNIYTNGLEYIVNENDKSLPLFVSPGKLLTAYREKCGNTPINELSIEDINNIWNASVNK